ncbi:MAG: hypothetical protein ACJ8G1_08790 [Vitreoscilla sp.]
MKAIGRAARTAGAALGTGPRGAADRRGARPAMAVALSMAACLPALAALAGEPEVRPRSPATDGSVVVDEQAHLAWSRCVEGMRWNGVTCVGEPAFMNHGEAVAAAAARARRDGVPWRLPRVGEMQHVARGSPPPLARMPATPAGLHWSTTAVVDLGSVNQYQYQNIRRHVTQGNANRIAFLHGWAVDLVTGQARDDVLKSTRLPARLVRSLD